MTESNSPIATSTTAVTKAPFWRRGSLIALAGLIFVIAAAVANLNILATLDTLKVHPVNIAGYLVGIALVVLGFITAIRQARRAKGQGIARRYAGAYSAWLSFFASIAILALSSWMWVYLFGGEL